MAIKLNRQIKTAAALITTKEISVRAAKEKRQAIPQLRSEVETLKLLAPTDPEFIPDREGQARFVQDLAKLAAGNKLSLSIYRRLFLSIFLLLLLYSSGLSAPASPKRYLTEFDLFRAELGEVFRSLAELGGFNILLDPKISGSVTLKLNHQLGIRETVELLARTHGYAVRWIEEAQTLIIGDESTFKNFEVLETRIYRLNYAQGEEVVPALKVAVPTEQVGVDARTNQLTIYASVLEHQNIAALLARLDQKMPQVKIDARIEEVRRSAMRDLGISWGFKEFSIDSKLHFNLTTIQTLQALEEQSNARLLVNPNVSSIDGKEAKIFIGDKFPVITTKQSENGIEYQIEYIEVGTILTITPVINEPNVVTVTVKAEVSTIVEWKKTGSGDDIPVILTREASSVVRLKENEVFVLSGFGIDPKAIAKANPQLPSEKLTAGQLIVIPVPANHLYRLKPGENLWRLAQRYGLPVGQLTTINQLPEVTNLKVGQLVVLPTPVEMIVNPAF